MLHEGTHFLVMEMVDGEALDKRLARGPLPIGQVLQTGSQIADALSRAHRQGIIHRDLKPANVMLTKAGATLLDFGLARSAADEAPIQGLTAVPAQAAPLTQEGTILGTFQYMAPEQLEADARTDIFAFGALLYEMATAGRPSCQPQLTSTSKQGETSAEREVGSPTGTLNAEVVPAGTSGHEQSRNSAARSVALPVAKSRWPSTAV